MLKDWLATPRSMHRWAFLASIALLGVISFAFMGQLESWLGAKSVAGGSAALALVGVWQWLFAKRLADAGFSSWWLLLWFVPVLGWGALAIMLWMRGPQEVALAREKSDLLTKRAVASPKKITPLAVASAAPSPLVAGKEKIGEQAAQAPAWGDAAAASGAPSKMTLAQVLGRESTKKALDLVADQAREQVRGAQVEGLKQDGALVAKVASGVSEAASATAVVAVVAVVAVMAVDEVVEQRHGQVEVSMSMEQASAHPRVAPQAEHAVESGGAIGDEEALPVDALRRENPGELAIAKESVVEVSATAEQVSLAGQVQSSDMDFVADAAKIDAGEDDDLDDVVARIMADLDKVDAAKRESGELPPVGLIEVKDQVEYDVVSELMAAMKGGSVIKVEEQDGSKVPLLGPEASSGSGMASAIGAGQGFPDLGLSQVATADRSEGEFDRAQVAEVQVQAASVEPVMEFAALIEEPVLEVGQMEPAQPVIAALELQVQGVVVERVDAASARVDEDHAGPELPKVELAALVEGLHASESFSISEIMESSMLGMASISAGESLEAEGQGREVRAGDWSVESAPKPWQGQVQEMVEVEVEVQSGVSGAMQEAKAEAVMPQAAVEFASVKKSIIESFEAEAHVPLSLPVAQVELQSTEPSVAGPALAEPGADHHAAVERQRIQGFVDAAELDASLVAAGRESGQSDEEGGAEDGEGDSDSQAGSASAALPAPVEAPLGKASSEGAEAFHPKSVLVGKPKLAPLGSLGPAQAALAEKFGAGKDGQAPWQEKSLGEALSKGAKAAALPFRGDRPVSKLKRNKEE